MFRRTIGLFFSHAVNVALVGVSLAGFSHVASAQAFLPPPGEGNVTVSYQDELGRGHLNNAGDLVDKEPVRSHSMMWEGEFGLNDRWALYVSLPFVTARYRGPTPHQVGINGQPSDLDDGTYHGAFQDLHLGVRFNVQSRPLAITPFAEAIIPSQHYESLGHAAVGQDLRALIVGATVGGFIDAVPGSYFQTQFSHAVVQEILGIRPNRSRVDSEVGYFVTPRFAVRFLGSFQFTHDGWDNHYTVAGPPDIDRFSPLWIHSGSGDPITFDHLLNHDRLMRSNFLNLGGGFVFGVTDSVEIFAAAAKTAWGQNIHPHRGLSVGANWHFRTRRRGLQPSPQRIGGMLPVRSQGTRH